MLKNLIGIDVLAAARDRISWTFDNFEKIYLSFSGGKDSTVMLHLVMDEAIKRNRKVAVLFIDWECQMTLTIDFIKSMYEKYEENIEPYWVALPITTWNSTSQIEPEWTSWDEEKRELWVREKDKISIKDSSFFPFYYKGQSFEEFVPLFAQWYGEGKKTACFVGIRTQESLNRFRTIVRDKPTYQDKKYTTKVIDDAWNVYPIYDWNTKDIWIYHGKTKKEHNKLYDRMHQAGLSIHQMRICEPFGDEARKGLWLYQVIEPEMWAKVCLRVAGANTGALYCNEKGNVLGNHKIALPAGHTYESFANHLLQTMPTKTANHYKNKLAVYINWWRKRGYDAGLPDKADGKLETSGKAPSWRRICKILLKNDYWCRGLGFSPTKSSAYKKYCELMARRRSDWNLYNQNEVLSEREII